MKKQIVILAVLAMISIGLSSCDDNITGKTGNYLSEDFSIPVWDYADNYYFLDTLYKRSFREWQEGITSGFQDSNRILINNTFEVWVQCEINTPNKRLCVGKVMLGARPPQGYDTSITNPEIIAGEKFAGYFRKLGHGTDYDILNYSLGYICLNINVPENYNVGIVYSNFANQTFGKGSYNSLATDTLILKLFKVANESPVTTPLAWQLKMKNVYDLHYASISPTTKLYLKYINDSLTYDAIPGYSTNLVTMLKLDELNNSSRLPPPDGICDFTFGKTVFPGSGSRPTYIIFPILEPFGQGLQDAGVSSEYQFNEIYTQRKSEIQLNAKANMYKLMGTAYYIGDK